MLRSFAFAGERASRALSPVATAAAARLRRSSSVTLLAALALAASGLITSSLRAQNPAGQGWLDVTLVTTTREPVVGAIVSLTPVARSIVAGQTDDRGRLRLGPVAAGRAAVQVRRLGYVTRDTAVLISAGDTVRLTIALVESAQTLGEIRIVSLRGDLTPEQRVDREQIAASVPHDASEVLRQLPGTDAMRRGALGLDPVVRGLRDTQLGVYVDAARTLPGGPAGMDTPLSHVDPAHVQSMEVITGPYALTWGAGNLSAIRVVTNALPSANAAPVAARLTSGYDGNLGASEFAGVLEGALGRDGRVRYITSGAWREGSDYTAGDGTTVASGFRSGEGRAKVGVRTGTNGLFSVMGAYQGQRDIDYPGRPLDADYFDTYHLQAEWSLRRAPATAGASAFRVRDVDVMAYVYDVDHLMDNDDKPTALPNPNRMPPFATKINTWSGVQVRGARASARLDAPAGWALEVGGDVYDADHDARREVDRRDNGLPVRRDLIWGGARIMDAGLFTRAERSFGKARVATTARVDFVEADTDTASAFFTQQYGANVSSSEVNWSGAATVRVPISQRWAVTGGLGSVVRTAEANERFSDRAAAKRAQTNAEFMGDPTLKPERSTQADLWLEAQYPRLAVQLNAFVRRLDDYITIAPTDLPRAQPGSPPTVFRFVNGRADYHGGELVVTSPVTSAVTLGGSLAYLHGDDITLDEPALGVTPLRADLRARLEPVASRWFLEAATHMAGEQTRVATTRGERATAGWTTVDVQAGYRLRAATRGEMLLRVGARNVFDRSVVQHLTALDAFTTGRIQEPGRVLFARVTVGL
jgi:iron complex outermembrane receptor protein